MALLGQFGRFGRNGAAGTPVEHLPYPPSRPENGHKGTFGTVIVIGGCSVMPGAPAICARAALRAGVGLVKIAADSATLPLALTIEPCATGIALPEDSSDSLPGLLDDADPKRTAVLATGPGLRERADAILDHVFDQPRAMVLDADALNALSRTSRTLRDAPAARILTPHPGEFRRIAEPLNITSDPTGSDADRLEAARRLAEGHGCVVLLKGRRSVVTNGEQWFINQTGNVALATAGSGDVLTGALAALLAAGMTPFDAASLGAAVHGGAADRWRDRHGHAGLRAFDLADELPDILEAVRVQR